METRDADDPGRCRPRPTDARPSAIESIADSIRALRLLDRLAVDGWRVEWSSRADGSWRARVGSPASGVFAEARGLSRVSAISAAHLAAIRLIDRRPPLDP